MEAIMKNVNASILLIFFALAGMAQKFLSPEEAVEKLVEAIKQADINELLRILGPDAKAVLDSGDKEKDQANRERFLEAYKKKNKLEKRDDGKLILEVGENDWQFPFPLAKDDNGWYFDIEAGKEEMLNRRIGRNELSTIEAAKAYVDAQREYYLANAQKDKISSYAQKFASTPNKRDGLYYEVKPGEKESPLGELYAKAQASKGKSDAVSGRQAYYGYFFRILTAQGPDAPGGAYDYIAHDKMFGGHGLIAWPANYGETGVKTFIVNHDGIVYEKDLGEDTTKDANEITVFNPDKSWKRVD